MSDELTQLPGGAQIKKGGTPSVAPGFPPVDPVGIRAMIMLGAANGMMADPEWPYREASIHLKSQGDEVGEFRIFGANKPETIHQVFNRELDIAIMNPTAILSMAHHGIGLFEESMQVGLIAVVPHDDQLGFAVSKESGLTSLDDVRERRYPLKLSVRGPLDQCTTDLVALVLKVHGFSYEDIIEWGGSVSYDQQMPPIGFPDNPSRLDRIASGEYDSMFEEGVFLWANAVEGLGMRFLDIAPERMKELELLGFEPAKLQKARYETLPADVDTVDFSGWPIYARIDTPDVLVRKFCHALETHKDNIPWHIGPFKQDDMPLAKMVGDEPDTRQMGIPFHPAAREYWTSKGYLS